VERGGAVRKPKRGDGALSRSKGTLHALGSRRFRLTQEDAMAKGQMRSNKEKKKPKADWNKKKKGSPPPSPFAVGQSQAKAELFGKKG
jgi:hypothetical protein